MVLHGIWYALHSKFLMCVCVVFPFILDDGLVDVPAGATQKEGHTGFLIHLPSAVLALMFLARRIQPFLSLVDREVEFLCTNESIVLHVLRHLFFFFVGKNPSSCDCTGIRTHVPASEDLEVSNGITWGTGVEVILLLKDW